MFQEHGVLRAGAGAGLGMGWGGGASGSSGRACEDCETQVCGRLPVGGLANTSHAGQRVK